MKIMIKTGENWTNIQNVANSYSSQLKTEDFEIKEENGKKVAKHKSPNLFMNEVRFDSDQADKETKIRYEEAQKYVLDAMVTHIHNREKDQDRTAFLSVPARERSLSTGSKRSLSGESDEEQEAKEQRHRKPRIDSPNKAN